MLFWIHLLMLLHPTVSATEPQRDTAAAVDRAVAIVGELVVTKTDIELHSALSDIDPSFVPILKSSKTDATQDTIDAAVVRQAAGRVPVYQPTAEQVHARMTRFLDQWNSNESYQTFLSVHGLTDDSIRTVLKRRAMIERVVLRALGPPKEDPDIWNARFTEWMNAERKGTRIQIIPRQDAP